MPKICFYLHLHQPYRLRDLTIFDVGKRESSYFSNKTADDNKKIFLKVTKKSYLPMLSLLLRLTKKHPDFVCAFSISGVFIEQAERYAPEVMDLLKALVATGRVEVLAETYYHSLASLYSKEEFHDQVKMHADIVWDRFGVRPTVFRNTELIYSNAVAEEVAKLGYWGMLTEAVDRYLHGRKRTQLFSSTGKTKLPLLLKHAEFSDDIAFRFSDRNWKWHPLTVDLYLDWIEKNGEEELINLFMDFETFGEHQWEDTGIFEFFEEFVARFISKDWNRFVTPSETIREYVAELPEQRGLGIFNFKNIFEGLRLSSNKVLKLDQDKLANLPIYDVPEPISWADVDRDLTAWTENVLQQDTLRKIYEIEAKVRSLQDKVLFDKWRKLQTSDHFYYMCTKWSADGDVHAYFSPYDSPMEAYRTYSIALADLHEQLF